MIETRLIMEPGLGYEVSVEEPLLTINCIDIYRHKTEIHGHTCMYTHVDICKHI